MLTIKMRRARRVAGQHRNEGDVIQNVQTKEATELVARGHAVLMPTEETRGSNAQSTDRSAPKASAKSSGKGKGG